MRVYGRSILERKPVELDGIDEIVFVGAHDREIVVSLYRARTDNRIEVRNNEGVLVILPRAANVVEVEDRR